MKELQGLTLAQQDHMLRGMPLGLAEKRRLRSGPAPCWLAVVGKKGPEPVVGGPQEGVGSCPGPGLMLPLSTERRPGPRGGSGEADPGSLPAAAGSHMPVSR